MRDVEELRANGGKDTDFGNVKRDGRKKVGG
jgi:hypothetical protein